MCISAPRALSAYEYHLTDLGLPPGFVLAKASAINNQQQIVGRVEDAKQLTHAFIWENGSMRLLDMPENSLSVASDINEFGEIVGTMLSNGQRHAFISRNDAPLRIGLIDEFPHLGGKHNFVPGVSIDNQSRVAFRIYADDEHQGSVLWNERTPIHFGLLAAGATCHASTINNQGHIGGQLFQRDGRSSAFLWHDGIITDLGTLGGTRAGITGLNDMGVAIGWSTINANDLSQAHAIIQIDGEMHDLGTLHGEHTRAYDINNANQIVGFSKNAQKRWSAFVWENYELTDLNSEIDPSLGYRLISSNGINDRGDIIAVGIRDNESRACLLSPKQPNAISSKQGSIHSDSENDVSTITPRLTRFEHSTANDAFRIEFQGSPDGVYLIEASTDLINWRPIGTANNNQGHLSLIDPVPGATQLRFYRAIQTD